MKKITVALLLAMSLIAPLCVTAGGSKDAESTGKVDLRIGWWGNPTRDERTLKVFDLYQAKYPNVTIEPETVGWAGYWDRINTQIAAGNAPDLMQQDYSYILQFIGRNQLTDLTPYVKNKTINLSGVDEAFLSGGRVDGKLYGISLGTNAVTIVYDPAVLLKAGIAEPKSTWTWADFEKISIEVFKKTGVQTLPVFSTDPRVGFDNQIRQTGASFFAKDGKSLGFTDTKLLEEYFAMQLRLLEAGALVNPEIAFVTVTPQEDPFSKGLSWVQYVWSNQVVSTQAAANRPVKITLVPKIAGSKRPGTYLKPSQFFAIPATSQNKDEVAKFLNYFLSDIEANNVLLGERGVPIVPEVRESVKAKLDPTTKMVFEFIDLVGKGNASPIDAPDPAATGEILKLFRDTTQSILLKKVSAKEGTANVMKQINAILAK